MSRWLRCLLALLAFLIAQPAAAQAARLRIVMVLDASGSMAQNDPQRLVRVASKMLGELTDERDHLTVMSFGSEVKILTEGSGADHQATRDAISTLGRIESCTDYAMALEAAAEKLPPPQSGERRVVLFLTDGRFEPVGERGCGRFEGAPDADKAPILERIREATQRFKNAEARVFTIALGAAPSRAVDSSAVLRRVAEETSGRYLEARTARDVPPIFARIFGALVGAPVMQYTLQKGRDTVEFAVPRGADRLHLVLVPDNTRDLANASLQREGKALAFEEARVETPLSGYRLARVIGDSAGKYRVKAAGSGRLSVLAIPDVGLALRIEGVPEVLPEEEPLAAVLGLRTRAGDAVTLAPDFLRSVAFTVTMNGQRLVEQSPQSNGEIKFGSKRKLTRGNYTLLAQAAHEQGFLNVAPVEVTFRVEPRFAIKVATTALSFDAMAEETPGPPLDNPVIVKLLAPDKVPARITLQVELPKEAEFNELFSITPTLVTFGPGLPREQQLLVQYQVPPRKLRGADFSFSGEIKLSPTPEHARLLTGDKQWSIPVKVRLRPWTLSRYLEEYKWQLVSFTLVLLLIIWLIGRMVAHKFPPKTRIHYQEVGQQFASDSLVKRYAKHGAYRSAKFKFPLGKKSRPKVWFRANGGRFEVVPAGGPVVVMDDSLAEDDRDRSKPFSGSWEQRYRIGDDYEVWLTRS